MKTSTKIQTKTAKKNLLKVQTNKKIFTNLVKADRACAKAERGATCKSAKKRRVFQVVRIGRTYIVCATPWAYRLQQQGRGVVMSATGE